MTRTPIAMTMGDPAGIGPELALRSWTARQPGAQQQLRADPGGIAHRHRDRRYVHGRISERRGQ